MQTKIKSPRPPTYKEEAAITTFEKIFEKQNKLKIERAVIQKDIDDLNRKYNKLSAGINRLTQVASVKRREIVEKK